jgi:GWxTD domain-containing protein
MSEKEKNDYKFKSSSFFVSDNFKEIIEEKSITGFEETVEDFWSNSDPLLLTDYNERLLEHYSRVAYSNLKFSVPESGISGWESDRGEILIRYGEPVNKIRFRPFISAGARTSLMLKTDVWLYEDKVLGFVDEYWTGNFRFSTPAPGSRHISQFAGDTDFFVYDLRRNDPESYKPKFNGPVLSVPYDLVQLKNLEDDSESSTQIYLNYALKPPDKLRPDEKFPFAHKYGLYFIDDSSSIKDQIINRIIESDKINNLKLTLYEKYQINTIRLETEHDTGKIAFEIIRDSDNGVFTSRLDYKIRKFKKDELDMSDIILANKIEKKNSTFVLQRGTLSILPNPLHTFTSISKLFIYYEAYNLTLNEDSTANFEQRITISKIEERSGIESAVNSVLGFFGLGDEEEKLTLTSSYQSFNKNTPVYIQIDMSKYEKGDYNVTVEIEDSNNGKVVSNKTVLRWK